jgi:hypothetical protein
MLLQVRTDNHIDNSEGLADRVRAEVEGALTRRFSDRLQRVEVYLQDVNSHKGGVDKRCTIEARLAGYQPVAVHNAAPTLDEAVSGAVDRLLHALEHALGRLSDRGGPVSMSGEPT